MTPLSVSEFDSRFAQLRPILEAYMRQRVSRENAEDLVSECFLRARHSLAVYDPARGLTAWLKGILDNLLRLHLRSLRIRREDFYGGDVCPVDRAEDFDSEAARQAQRRQFLLACIAQVDLTARQYECLQRSLAGETQQKIACSLGISQRMVSAHIHAAQEHLRVFFQEAEPDTGINFVVFFQECAHHPLYRKPHSFDNQSNSLEREQNRYTCLDEPKKAKTKRIRQAI